MAGYRVYKVKDNLANIWDKNKKPFEGKNYKIVKEFFKKYPVYRSDYIEPYDYDYIEYFTIECLETGEQIDMARSYFITLFDFCHPKYVEEEEK